MTNGEYVRRGAMVAYVSKASGRGQCCACAVHIKKGATQFVISSKNAGARTHIWCAVKGIILYYLIGRTR